MKDLKLALFQATGGYPISYGYPLSFGYIASYLSNHLTLNIEIIITSCLKDILREKPNLVGIGSVTSCFDQAIKIAEKIKGKMNIPVIIGGYHISALPHKLPEVFDIGIIGEGEATMRELLSLFLRKGEFYPEDLIHINGIVFHSEQGLIITRKRDLIELLDSLPFPWRSPNPFNPQEACFFTSRGCLYKCIFCSSSQHWGKLRMFSAEYVVEEIEEVITKNQNIKSIYLLDDLFILNRGRFEKIVKLISDKKINRRVSFHGFIRADLLDEALCKDLKRMNFSKVRFGAESGSEKILRDLKKDSVTVEDNQRTIDLCNKFGIPVTAAFMVGHPEERIEDLKKTLEFIERNRKKMAVEGFYMLSPFPGTELWDWALKRGLVNEDMGWNRLNQLFQNPDFDWRNFVYLNKYIPKAEFIKIVRGSKLGGTVRSWREVPDTKWKRITIWAKREIKKALPPKAIEFIRKTRGWYKTKFKEENSYGQYV